MNELTMVLDELDDRVAVDVTGAKFHNLPDDAVLRLVETLRSQGGDQARIASVIEALASERVPTKCSPQYKSPTGSVTMPGTRSDARTLTAGNGIMSGSGI